MQFRLKHLLLLVTAIALTLVVAKIFKGEPDATRLAKMSSAFETVQDNLGVAIVVAHLGGFIDDEYAWCAIVPKGQLDEVLAILGLAPTEKPPPAEFLAACNGPWWCSQVPASALAVYKSSGFEHASRGLDGEHFMAAYDNATDRLYVWHKHQPF